MRRLKVYFHNVGGIKSDTPSLLAAIDSSEYDVIVLIETWLNGNIPSSSIFDSDKWEIFRRDRCANGDTREGGGVLVAVRKHLCPTDVVITVDPHTEQIWAKICLPTKNVFVCAAYIPPYVNEELYDRFASDVKRVTDSMEPQDDVFVFGDFNKPDLKWIQDIDDPNILNPTGSNTKFVDAMADMGLHQICNIKVNNQLDLIFTNVVGDYEVSIANHALKRDSQHHRSILLEYVTRFDVASDCPDEFYDFRKADNAKLSSKLQSIDWDVVCGSGDLNNKVMRFYSSLYNVIDDCVPKRKRRKNKCKWMTPQLARLRNRRNRAFRKLKRDYTNHNVQHFIRLRNEYLNLESALHKQHVERQAQLLKTDPKQFWKIINGRRGTAGIPAKVKYGRVTANDAQEAANLFADFFQAVYAAPANLELPSGPNPNRLSVIQLTHDELVKGLLDLDINKGAGPDRLPNFFLKGYARELAPPLLSLFNESLSIGVFPSSWKTAFVIPLFKSGLRSEISNYRGICILSAVPKLFEKLVTVKVEAAVHCLINTNQHGFEKGRSTCSNLVVYVSRLLEGVDGGGQIDAIYTDMAKAFDRVDHRLLLRKLELAGIDGMALSWIRSYLDGRSSTVNIESCSSHPILATSGVPQGSHMGPLLFSLFINDLAESLGDDGFLLYADDLKIYRKIKTATDAVSLQRTLNLVVRWCESNGMSLNVNKCEAISFKRQSSNRLSYNYSIDGVVLRRVEVVKDLGILIDAKLTFKQQIDSVVSRGKSTLYLMKMFAKSFNCPYVSKTLYTALVRPLVEYCAVVWSPSAVGDIKRIESIQKQYLLFALRDQHWSNRFELPPYEARLSLLQLDTLEDRRRLATLSFVHGCLSGTTNVPEFSSFFQFAVPSRVTRSAAVSRLCRPSFSRAAFVENGPVRRAIDTFNDYAALYEQGVSAESFKSRIKAAFMNERRIRLVTKGYLRPVLNVYM